MGGSLNFAVQYRYRGEGRAHRAVVGSTRKTDEDRDGATLRDGGGNLRREPRPNVRRPTAQRRVVGRQTGHRHVFARRGSVVLPCRREARSGTCRGAACGCASRSIRRNVTRRYPFRGAGHARAQCGGGASRGGPPPRPRKRGGRRGTPSPGGGTNRGGSLTD